MANKTLTVTVTCESVKLEVTGRYCDGSAVRTRDPGPDSPDEDDFFDIHKVEIGGQDIGPLLDEEVVSRIESLAIEAAREEI